MNDIYISMMYKVKNELTVEDYMTLFGVSRAGAKKAMKRVKERVMLKNSRDIAWFDGGRE